MLTGSQYLQAHYSAIFNQSKCSKHLSKHEKGLSKHEKYTDNLSQKGLKLVTLLNYWGKPERVPHYDLTIRNGSMVYAQNQCDQKDRNGDNHHIDPHTVCMPNKRLL